VIIGTAGKRATARAIALVATAISSVGLLVAGFIAGPTTAASAYDGTGFDPGYIISDQQFYAGDALTETEIQNFLNTKRPTCRAGYTCLKDYRMTTQSKAADPMCTGYAGAANESSARIIAKVAAACSISPKVLLVMLQKEQGLITDDWPTAGQYAAAMGAGCPDTAGCDPAQAGFFQQVYFAAWYLKRYGQPAGTGPGTAYTSTFNGYSNFASYSPGRTFAVQYHPNVGCGYAAVYIRNQPTASLYTYTPYTPNAAALANMGTYGDSCSSYGNRNFWDYYYSWFGNPTGIVPTNTTASRLAGVTRYDTAVAISQARGDVPAAVVYVASGTNYPDALSAAPAATMMGGPLLLVDPNAIPPVVATELQRLKPGLIVVVGSESAVSASVFDQLATLAPAIRRDSGADRFETSRVIAQNAFATSTTAYIATGLGFADALTAGAAAGAKHAPVILVNGAATTVDQATIDTLATLGVTNVIIAGSSAVVSDGVAASLAAIPGMTVLRLGGKDRFATASAVTRNAFPTSPTVYLAVGLNFPDALAGAALAGSQGSGLLLTPPNCIFRQGAQDLIDLRATKAVILGSTDVMSSNVATFVNCD